MRRARRAHNRHKLDFARNSMLQSDMSRSCTFHVFLFSFFFSFWAPERWQIQNDQGRRGKDAILQRSKPPRSFSIPFTRSVRACFFLSSSLISASSLARSSFEIGALAVASSASSS